MQKLSVVAFNVSCQTELGYANFGLAHAGSVRHRTPTPELAEVAGDCHINGLKFCRRPPPKASKRGAVTSTFILRDPLANARSAGSAFHIRDAAYLIRIDDDSLDTSLSRLVHTCLTVQQRLTSSWADLSTIAQSLRTGSLSDQSQPSTLLQTQSAAARCPLAENRGTGKLHSQIAVCRPDFFFSHCLFARHRVGLQESTSQADAVEQLRTCQGAGRGTMLSQCSPGHHTEEINRWSKLPQAMSGVL
jgi:hypothetical protein